MKKPGGSSVSYHTIFWGGNMAIRLVAIDLDDTLLDSQHRISSVCIEAIQKARKRGVLITLATGRMFKAALPYAEQIGIDLPLIIYQGALVMNSRSQKVFYCRPIPTAVIMQVIAFLQQHAMDYHLYTRHLLHARDRSRYLEKHVEVTGVQPSLHEDLDAIAGREEILEIMALAGSERSQTAMYGHLKEQFGECLHITPFKYHTLELMDREANKARALEFLARRYRISREEVMAIGDGHNDRPMLEWAGIGVAMGNASEAVKEAADFITLSNDEEGVAAAIHEYVLKSEK